MSRNFHLIALIFIALSLFKFTLVFASTPAEMAEFSIQDLMNMSIEESHSSETSDGLKSIKNRLEFGLIYRQKKFDGYRSGTKDLSNDEVLFSGEAGTRSHGNYPVLPTVITQEAAIATLSYHLNRDQIMEISIPYIKQSTDHESIVPGYDVFNITSEGLGDISLGFNQVIKHWFNKVLITRIGVSIPSGSIDQKGDTPRAPGNQQLPYTMQLGTGTWDIAFALIFQSEVSSKWLWGNQISGKKRLAENDRNYTLGDRLALSTWLSSRHSQVWQPRAKITYQYWGSIQGQDDEITVPGDFPYPANITNPANFGGHKVSLALGLSLIGGETALNNHKLELEYELPVYLDLNGVQNKEIRQINIRWSLSF